MNIKCFTRVYDRFHREAKIAVNQLENFVSENVAKKKGKVNKNDLITLGTKLLIKRNTQTPVNRSEEMNRLIHFCARWPTFRVPPSGPFESTEKHIDSTKTQFSISNRQESS